MTTNQQVSADIDDAMAAYESAQKRLHGAAEEHAIALAAGLADDRTIQELESACEAFTDTAAEVSRLM